MKKIMILFISLFMILGMIPATTKEAHADEINDVDLVLVLDHSNSMWKDNDPNEMMKNAAQLLVTMLPKETVRVGVITFSSDRTTICKMTALEKGDNVDTVVNKIKEATYSGGTDIGNPFADAVNMFNLNDGRKHAIVLFSDGENDFTGKTKRDEIESNERLDAAIATAKNNNIEVYTIGFGNVVSNPNNKGYQMLKQIASTDENFMVETDAFKIHKFFLKVLEDLGCTKIQNILDNKVTIGKYTKEAEIYIESNDKISGNVLQLINSNSQNVELNKNDNARYYEYDHSAVITLRDPTPGDYTVVTNTGVNIDLGYVALYNFSLKTAIFDEDNHEVDEVENNNFYTFHTKVIQEGKEIHDPELYDSATATAVITPRLSGKSETVKMAFKDGEYQASYNFKELCTYDIKIVVESDSFELNDKLEVNCGVNPIRITGNIKDKTIDKTGSKSKTIIISNQDLDKVIKNPDKLQYSVIEAKSSKKGNVEAVMESDGLHLTGKKWGSSIITVTFKDEIGDVVSTSFSVNVKDLVAVFKTYGTAISIAVAILALVLYVLSKSNRIIGQVTVLNTTIEGAGMPKTISNSRTFDAKVFGKKSFAEGIENYAKAMNRESPSEAVDILLRNLKSGKDLTKALKNVKFKGTYLGKKGIKVLVKKNQNLALGSDQKFGQRATLKINESGSFMILVQDKDNLYTFDFSYRKKTSGKKSNGFDDFDDTPKSKKKEQKKNSSSFDDFDDF